MVIWGPEKAHKHLAHKQFPGHRSSRPDTRTKFTKLFMFLGFRKHLTPGHPVKRPSLTQAITGQNCLCLCAFSFPESYAWKLSALTGVRIVKIAAKRGFRVATLPAWYRRLTSQSAQKSLIRVRKVFSGLRSESPKTISCTVRSPVLGCCPRCEKQDLPGARDSFGTIGPKTPNHF